MKRKRIKELSEEEWAGFRGEKSIAEVTPVVREIISEAKNRRDAGTIEIHRKIWCLKLN